MKIPQVISGSPGKKCIVTHHSISEIEYHPATQVFYIGKKPAGSGNLFPAGVVNGHMKGVSKKCVRFGSITRIYHLRYIYEGAVHTQRVQNSFFYILVPAFSGYFPDNFPGGNEHHI